MHLEDRSQELPTFPGKEDSENVICGEDGHDVWNTSRIIPDFRTDHRQQQAFGILENFHRNTEDQRSLSTNTSLHQNGGKTVSDGEI